MALILTMEAPQIQLSTARWSFLFGKRETVHASHLQRTTREHFDPNVLESTEVSAVPAGVPLFQEIQGTMEVPQDQYIDRIVDVSVCCNTNYILSEQCTSRRWKLFRRQSSMIQKGGRDPPSAVH